MNHKKLCIKSKAEILRFSSSTKKKTKQKEKEKQNETKGKERIEKEEEKGVNAYAQVISDYPIYLYCLCFQLEVFTIKLWK